jgi:hypothetical protein
MNLYIILLFIPLAFLLAYISIIIKNHFFSIREINSYERNNTVDITRNHQSSQKNEVYELKNMVNNLKIILDTSNHLVESSEKKNLTKVLNRVSQGLFRFLNGELTHYKKEDVALLFEEIQDLFTSVNHGLIIPKKNDFFNHESMIAREFEHTDNPDLINKVFRTTILGIKEISRGEVIKKAEVILYKKR